MLNTNTNTNTTNILSRYILFEEEKKEYSSTSSRITQLPQNRNVFLLPNTNIHYYISHGLFEKDLIDWAKQFCNKSKITLDIGAHTGTYGISLASVSKKVICFEPQKATFHALCGSVALSNLSDTIDCYCIALGNQTQHGQKPLYIVSEDGGGSTLIKESRIDRNIIRTEMVEIRTLDSFEWNNIGFIKMDVEENEYYVLEGAKETLKQSNYPPILFESNFHDPEVFALLKEMSYEIHNIRGYSNMFIATATATATK